VAARESFRRRNPSRLKDAKNKEVKPGWNVEYNHSHTAAVSRPSCRCPSFTPVSQESGNDQ